MSNVKQIFESDMSTTLTIEKFLRVQGASFDERIPFRVHYDLNAGVMFISVYLEEKFSNSIDQLVADITRNIEFIAQPDPVAVDSVILPGDKTLPSGYGITVENSDKVNIIVRPQDGKNINLSTLPFSGRIFLYTEFDCSISPNVLSILDKATVRPRIRGITYAKKRAQKMLPKAFISHDSRDKGEIARPLANALQTIGCPVWYDEYSMQVGDSLRDSIEKGLKETQYCILLLSPNFLSKGGWPKREYDSAFTREIIEDRNLILPIWHNVTAEDVYEYSPILADRIGLNSGLGIDEIARKLLLKIEQDA
ncbi:toll/interleukin-1 receptor domain-containing protein [Desulfoluna butyratoxydans]|uniref:Tir domain n=1 Tax=Desulfoluna butyratoxydans TaxID=231438 RepID=A0A4V6YUF9_9BACT|nr:toll/interleukin-1 receptor domain-containing protein [Desulfoluna butyratoxydans]VFQ47028.1 tir domain [Desulfoluna butyratoxydans]